MLWMVLAVTQAKPTSQSHNPRALHAVDVVDKEDDDG